MEENDRDGAEQALAESVGNDAAGARRIQVLVDAQHRSKRDPYDGTEGEQQNVRLRIEEKDLLEREVSAGVVGGFERGYGEERVRPGEEKLNAFSMMSKHGPRIQGIRCDDAQS